MFSIAPFRFYRGLAIDLTPRIIGQRRSHRNVIAILSAACLVTAAGYALTCTGTRSAQQELEPVENKANEMAKYTANAASISSQMYEDGTSKRKGGVLRFLNMSRCEIDPSEGIDYEPCIMRRNLHLTKVAGRSGAPHMSTLQIHRGR